MKDQDSAWRIACNQLLVQYNVNDKASELAAILHRALDTVSGLSHAAPHEVALRDAMRVAMRSIEQLARCVERADILNEIAKHERQLSDLRRLLDDGGR